MVNACAGQNLKPGSSFDLTNGWDFTRQDHKLMAIAKIREERPNLLIGSPPCTYFSILQNLNLEIRNEDWRQNFYAEREKAADHVRFCVKLYRMQAAAGRYWLHEHPRSATSWQIPEMKKLMSEEGVVRAESDLCRFGMKIVIKGEEMAAKKPTSFATNAWVLGRELAKRCEGGHIHGHLMEGRAKAAAVYPPELCVAICRGLR